MERKEQNKGRRGMGWIFRQKIVKILKIFDLKRQLLKNAWESKFLNKNFDQKAKHFKKKIVKPEKMYYISKKGYSFQESKH